MYVYNKTGHLWETDELVRLENTILKRNDIFYFREPSLFEYYEQSK